MKKTTLVVLFLIFLTAQLSAMERAPGQDGRGDKKQPKPPSDESVFCTMDAKMCPDGSFVGRVPPDCKFAPCPDTKKSK